MSDVSKIDFVQGERYLVVNADCVEAMKIMEENSIDSIVTDPPYDLVAGAGGGFMGLAWDATGVAFDPATWRAALRVLKPGGFLLSFGGTRTSHRMVSAIEDAGFEIRDGIDWIYGCLSDDTELLTSAGWKHYSEINIGDRALCYDLRSNGFSFGPVQNVYVYDYADTAFRLRSDLTDQIVSRNHRCLVESGGGFAFRRAEKLEHEARVPVVEDVSALLDAVYVLDEGAGFSEPFVQSDMRGDVDRGFSTQEGETSKPSERIRRPSADVAKTPMFYLSENILATSGLDSSRSTDVLFQEMQRGRSWACVGEARTQSICCADAPRTRSISPKNERSAQPSVAGRRNVQTRQRKLHRSEVCAMPEKISTNGEARRLHNGASVGGGESVGSVSSPARGSASPEPQYARQPQEKPCFVSDESRSQVVRGTRFTTTDLVRVEPIFYEGIVWCVRVPTGSFVARRSGKVFITGNSGFPKSLDVGKAIDKVVGLPDPSGEWSGFGTALKPSHEPICVARKPTIGTIAANVLAYGTGALNIDASRIGVGAGGDREGQPSAKTYTERGSTTFSMTPGPIGGDVKGRWPSNTIFSHSDLCVEVGMTIIKGKSSGSGNGSAKSIYSQVANSEGNGGNPGEPDAQAPLFACVPGCPVRTLDEQSGFKKDGVAVQRNRDGEVHNKIFGARNYVKAPDVGFGGAGGASRFFYVAKPAQKERHLGCEGLYWRRTETGHEPIDHATWESLEPKQRAEGNTHPTVKPSELMRYLVRLVTPPGGTVLDPFGGSGSTAVGALKDDGGFSVILIEREESSAIIALARTEYAARKKALEHLGSESGKKIGDAA